MPTKITADVIGKCWKHMRLVDDKSINRTIHDLRLYLNSYGKDNHAFKYLDDYMVGKPSDHKLRPLA